jgi:signal transduction histidine kinase
LQGGRGPYEGTMELLAGILVAWAMVNIVIMSGMMVAFFAFGRERHYAWLGLFYACVAVFCLARAANYLGAGGAHPFLFTRVLLASIAVAGCSILCLALDRSDFERRWKVFPPVGVKLVTAALVATCLFGPVANHALPGEAIRVAFPGDPATIGYRFTIWAYATLLISLLYAGIGAALLIRGARNDPMARTAFLLGIIVLALLAAHDILVYTGFITSIPIGEHGAFVLGLFILFAFLRETDISRDEAQASGLVLEQTSEHLDRAADETRKLRPMADLGRLAASLAHQIRNPLAVIGNVTVTLRHWKSESGTAESYAQMMEMLGEETRRLARLVDDLLLYSGKSMSERGPVQPGDLVQAALGEARESFPPQSATEIVTRIEKSAGQLRGNAAGLRRALSNLIVNAVQSSGGEGKVELVARASEDGTDTVLLGVSDSGGGVPEELEEEIFEPYYSTRSTGTGLGLAIARRIAEEHSGSLLLENRPGKGASFWMKLPLAGVKEEDGEKK